jgi:FLYWCH zinc finger domain
MEIIDSTRGVRMILHEGYSYRLHRTLADGETVSYRCPAKDCKGRAHVNGDIVLVVTEHTCGAPNPAKNVARTVSHAVKRRAIDTHETPRQIITAAQGNLAAEEAAAVPSYVALQQQIERKRKRENHPYQEPENVADFVVPDELSRSEGNQNFILHDSGANDLHRFIMFGTQENIDILGRHRDWFVDGTFRVAPRIFMQVCASDISVFCK